MQKFILTLFSSFLIVNTLHAQFIENKGQVLDRNENLKPEVNYYYETPDASVFFLNDRVVYAFTELDPIDESLYLSNVSELDSAKANRGATFHRMDMLFAGANSDVKIVTGEKLQGETHFYLNKRNGIRDVGTFNSITYENLYPNIDVIFHQSNKGMKYDIVLKRGANIEDVKIQYLGAKNLHLKGGKAYIETTYKTLQEDIPFSFIDGDKNKEVRVKYTLTNKNTLMFETLVKDYQTLTIDPVLEWGTYFNGSAATTNTLDYETNHLDEFGNFYIYGTAWSAANNFPVVSPGATAYAANYNAGSDVYLAKFNANRALVWATYLGGSGSEYTHGNRKMATGGTTLHIVGETMTAGAPYTDGGGFYNTTASRPFWARFNLNTGALLHLTSTGGGGYKPSIAVSNAGRVAIIMDAYNFNNPIIVNRAGAFNQATNGGFKDMFLMMFDASYNQIWGTFLGGPGTQENFMCIFDNSENLLFAGESSWLTGSDPTTERLVNLPGAYYQSVHGGGTDVMLGKFNSSGQLVWNTLFGGDNSDARQGQMGGYAKLLLHPTSGEPVLVFNTTSSNLPTINPGGGAYFKTVPTHTSFAAGGSFWNYAAYIAKFSTAGALNYATYWYNTTDGDVIFDANFGGCNKFYVGGRVDRNTVTTIPITGGFNLPNGRQTFVMQFNAGSFAAEWSSFMSLNESMNPSIAGRADNPRTFISAKGYYSNGPTVDPGNGAYYQPVNINTPPDNPDAFAHHFMIWQIHPALPPIITGDTVICSGTSTTLTASGGAGAPYQWYTVASGGTPFHTGAIYNTPNLSSNTTYYVSSGSGDCASGRTRVNITMLPSATGSVTYNGCENDGYSVIVGGTTYDQTNPSGTEILPTGGGCDSVVTVNLTFRPNSVGNVARVGCEGDGYSVVVGGVTFNESNPSGIRTLPSANGCDSVVTVNLTFNPNSVGNVTHVGCEGDGYSVVVGGVTFNESNPSGVRTLPSANDCDSVVTVNLTFLPSSAVTITHSGCEGDGFSVVVDGTTYDETNPTGTETLTAVNGCDSLITINLSFQPFLTGNLNYFGCENDGYSVVVGGTTYDETNPSGTETLTAANGCDSLVTIDLSFQPFLTGDVNYAGCEGDGYSVVVDGTTYDETNPSGTETLVTVSGCDSVVTINLIFVSPDFTFETQSSCLDTDTGVFVNTFVNAFGCDSTHTVTVNLLPSDSTFENLTSCNSADTGVFVFNETNQFGCDSTHTRNISLLISDSTFDNQTSCNPIDTGVFVFDEINQFGCDSVHTRTVTLLLSDTTSENTTTCDPAQEGSVVLNLTNQFGCDSTHTITTTLLPLDTTQENLTSCDPADEGSVVLNLINQFGCDSTHTITTTLLPSSNTFENQTTCDPAQEGTVVLNLTNQFGCDSTHTIITDLLPSNNTQESVSSCDPAAVGTVVLNLTNQFGCDSTHMVNTTLSPSSNTSANATSCNPADVGTVVLNLTNQFGCDSTHTITTTLLESDATTENVSSCNPDDAGTVVLNLINQFGCDSTHTINTLLLRNDADTITNVTCFANEAGVSSTVFTNEFGCDSVFTVVTTLIENNYELAPDYVAIRAGESVEFVINNEDNNLEFSWVATDGQTCNPPCESYLVNSTEAVTHYYFTLVDTSTGCINNDTLRVDLEYFSELNVPNIFTPNNDGQNDVYRAYGADLLEFNMMIFDRWGGKMFETTNINEGWDGNFKGKPLASGVYMVLIKASGIDSKQYEITQNFKLVR